VALTPAQSRAGGSAAPLRALRIRLTPTSPIGRLVFAFGVLALLCLFCAPLFVDQLAHEGPQVRLGKVSFTKFHAWDRAVPLEGDWLLTWRGPETPGGPQNGDAALAKVPGRWEGLRTAGGAALPPSGLATYQLTLRGLPPGDYTLFVPTITHASRVRVDDRVVSTHGRLGATAEATRYLWRPHTVPVRSEGADVTVAIDIAAFHHVSNGLEGTPVIGLSPVMDSRLALAMAQELLFIVTLVVLFFYGVVVWIFRPSDRASLWFALACIFLTPTAMVIGHDNLMALEFPGLTFVEALAVEYLTCIVSFMFLLAYAHALFPRESPRPVFWTIEALFLVALAVVGATLARGDTLLASRLDPFALYLAAFELVWIILVVALAAWRQREGAAIFLLGVSVFAVTAVQAILVQYAIVPEDRMIGYAYAPMGMVIFSFTHIIILAERWARAMLATEASAADLRRLMEVSASITSEVRLDALLRKVVEATSRFLGADRSTLFLHDPRSGQLWSMVAEGMETREIRMASDQGVAGDSFTSGREVIVNDPYADPRFNRAVDEATGYRTRAMLAVPIVTRDGRRLGVMQALNRTDGRPFDAADVARMRAFAAQAAVAIDNASLFSGIVAARNYAESILASMSGGVITLNADGAVETINAAAARILEVEAEAVKGLPAADLLTGANAWLVGELEAVARDGAVRAMLDVEAQTAHGRAISVNLSIVPLVNEGAPAGLLVLFEDISQDKRLRGAMRRFMSQKVVDQVLERQDELMFGADCTASVLFADIRNFTSMAESLKARETVDMLNEVFAELVEAVGVHDGVVDKFIGDAVMAVYGAPISSGRDPLNAVDSAAAMMAMVSALNQRRAARDQAPLRLGIGVATGEIIAGTIGSPKRMDYTVIGDSVNLASRLQDLTKQYGVGVILDEATARALDGRHRLRRLDTVGVRGRNRPERIFQLLTYLDEESFPHPAELVAAYERGLACLEAEDWRGAVNAFTTAHALNPADPPSELMLKRARAAVAGVAVG
jgi:adenylate cyclase